MHELALPCTKINATQLKKVCVACFASQKFVCWFGLQTRTQYQRLIQFYFGFPLGDILALTGKIWGLTLFCCCLQLQIPIVKTTHLDAKTRQTELDYICWKKISMITVMVTFFLVALLGIGFVAVVDTLSCSISAGEFNSLESLYEDANGIDWRWSRLLSNSTRWSFPASLDQPCTLSWQGLTCESLSDDLCSISGLQLSYFNMSGKLPDNIGNLSDLKYLNISHNSIGGSIPSSIGSLFRLLIIDMEYNQFGLDVPPDIGNLTLLTELHLAYNSLIGTLPSQLGRLTDMAVLDLSSNYCRGFLPTELGLLTKMQYLLLDSCNFEGPIANITLPMIEMRELNLDSNRFNGAFPVAVSCINIFSLDLGGNKFSGELPQDLCGLTALRFLYLDANNYTGPIPSCIGQLSLLIEVDISNNILSSSIPTGLGLLTNLAGIDMLNNKLTGAIPSQIGNLLMLQVVSFAENLLSSTVPSEIGLLEHLATIQIYGSSLQGTLPSSLGNLRRLIVFEAGINHFEGPIPTELGLCTNIVFFNLGINSMTGKIPSELMRLSALHVFNVSFNHLSGTISTEIGKLYSLGYLILNDNHFSGTIASSICDLPILQFLYLNNGNLHGSVPNCVFNSSRIQSMQLCCNNLTGTIPSQLSALHEMILFDISSNDIHGTFPEFMVSDWRLLEQLFLSDTYIRGLLPSSFGFLKILQVLDVSSTLLSGKILITVFYFHFIITCLEIGTIPSQIDGLAGLTVLNMSSSFFEGTLPSSLGLMSKLVLLYADNNYLSGFIPSLLVDLRLEYLSLSGNMLSGSIPDTLIALPKLQIFDISSNRFSGSVPLRQQLSKSITVFVVGSNYFTGTVMSDLVEFDALKFCFLDTNLLWGPLPNGSAALFQFSADYNSLEGTISRQFWLNKRIQGLSLSNNKLYGPIPTGIEYAGNLTNLDVSNNRLTGNLELVFPTALNNLTYLNLANNSFEGQIPSTLFLCPSLEVVVLNSNCFSGTIPENICDASGLQSVILDSLSTGCKWDLGIFGRFIKGLFPSDILKGTIPSCLLQLQNLTALQLSGNGLKGSIPDVNLSASLTNLQLALNALTGPVPQFIQQSGQFEYLYLQNNRLSGTLNINFAVLPSTTPSNRTSSYMELKLGVNRLSGEIPETFLTMPNISVVTGNLFQCDMASLPVHDPGSNTYSCGSTQLDNALYVWLSVTVTVLAAGIAIAVIVRRSSPSVHKTRDMTEHRGSLSVLSLATLRSALKSHETDELENGGSNKRESAMSIEQDTNESALPQSVLRWAAKMYEDTQTWISYDLSIKRKPLTNTIQYCLILKYAGRGAMLIAAAYLVCLVSYLILRSVPGASTTTFQYGWTMTSAYLHGLSPALLIFTYVLGTLMMCLFSLSPEFIASAWNIRSVQREEWRSVLRYDGQFGAITRRLFDVFIRPAVAHAIHFTTVLIVNVVYVAALINVPSQYIFFTQAALSSFKVLWVNGYVPFAMGQMQYMSSQAQFRHQVAMILVVYILGPVIATLGANSNCFYDALFGSSAISSTFNALNSGYACTINFNSFRISSHYGIYNAIIECSLYSSSLTSETKPPFVYSYQCGSSFLADYVPVLFYAYLYAAVLLPAVRFWTLHWTTARSRRELGKLVYAVWIHNSIFDYESCIEDYKILIAPKVVPLPSAENVQLSSFVSNPIVKRAPDCARTSEMDRSISSPRTSDASGIISSVSNVASVVASPSSSTLSSPRSSVISVSRRQDIIQTPLFYGTVTVAKRIADFCVILTFGLACPLLAVTVALSMLANSFTWRLMIGKFICSVGKNNIVAFTRLEESYCDGLLRGCMGGLWLTVPVISLFWSLMFYDMVADLYGDITGYIFVGATFSAIPTILYISYRHRKWSALREAQTRTEQSKTLQEVLAGRFNLRTLSDDSERTRSKNHSTDFWIKPSNSVLPHIPSAESNSNF
jgi:Leucine-rich repeat (LRR) protein